MNGGEGLPNDGRDTAGQCFAALEFPTAFKSLLLALSLIIAGPVLAAGFSCAQPADSAKKSTLDELEEVVVTAEEATTSTKNLQAWLRLLVGKYSYEGYVDLCGNGNAQDQRPVTGKSDCVASGSTPNVHCTINVRWPAAKGENGLPVLGGVSTLLPALVSYSLESREIPEIRVHRWGLMFVQVDNRGIAEWGSGVLVGDTFTSMEPCVGIGIAGACQKITRITAKPDSNDISMLVDIKIDSRRVLRQAFLMHRESNTRKNEQPGGLSP